MLSTLGLLFIFLHQPFEYQIFVSGDKLLASSRPLALDSNFWPYLISFAMLAVIILFLLFGQTFFNWVDVI